MQIIQLIKILRPINLIISILCVLLSAVIIDNFNILPIMLVIVFLGGFANIMNDIIDYKTDQVNNLNRPIANNQISIYLAIVYALLLFVLAMFIIYYYNFDTITNILIFGINLPLIVLYTPIFKKIPLLGNLVVGLILSMVFITTATYLFSKMNLNNNEIAQLWPRIFIPAILAFLLMTIREIVKDIADLKGDQVSGIMTLPVKYGINASFYMVIIFCVLLFCVSVYPYYIGLYNLYYMISISIGIYLPMLYYMYSFSKNKTSQYCIFLSKVLKLVTILGVIVIYLTSI